MAYVLYLIHRFVVIAVVIVVGFSAWYHLVTISIFSFFSLPFLFYMHFITYFISKQQFKTLQYWLYFSGSYSMFAFPLVV